MADGFDYAGQQTAVRSFDNGTMVPTGNDAAYNAEFYTGKVPNFEGTDYREVTHVRLRLPGDNNRVYDQPAILESTPNRPSDPERFPQAWNAFQRGESVTGGGTPLTEWDGAEPGDCRRLEMQGIRTIEQLANLGDHQLPALGMGARALREGARSYLNGTLIGRDNARDEQVEKLMAIVNNLTSLLTPEQIEALQGGGEKPRARRA